MMRTDNYALSVIDVSLYSIRAFDMLWEIAEDKDTPRAERVELLKWFVLLGERESDVYGGAENPDLTV